MKEYSPEAVSSDSKVDEKNLRSQNVKDEISPEKFGLNKTSETFSEDDEGEKDSSEEQEEAFSDSSSSTEQSPAGESLELSLEEEFSEQLDFYSDFDLQIKPFSDELLTSLQKEDDDKQLSIIEARLYTIAQIKQLWEERKSLKLKNNLLHKKCKNFLGRYKIMSYFEKPSAGSIYDDKRYEEVLDTFKSMQSDTQIAEGHYRNELRELGGNYQDKLFIFEELKQQLLSQQLQLSQCLEGNYSPKKIQFLMRRQERRMRNLTKIRVKFFKLKNFLERITDKSDRLNDYGEGQTVNLYTNLLATKNSLGERLDEREEEVGRIRKQILTMAPTLCHLKETCRGLSIEIDKRASKLRSVAGITDKNRVLVGKRRRKKDLLRKDFSKLHQAAFLLVNPKLLQFLLNSAKEREALREKIANMKLLHTKYRK